MSYKIEYGMMSSVNMFRYALDTPFPQLLFSPQVRVRVLSRFIHTQTAADELHVAALAKEPTT